MHNSILFGYKSISSEYKSSENILPDETTYNRFCSKTRKDASLSPKDASFLYLDKFILRRIPKRDKELPCKSCSKSREDKFISFFEFMLSNSAIHKGIDNALRIPVLLISDQ